MNKKGLSDFIVVLIFIILAILALIVLYNLARFFLQEQGEIVQIKSELLKKQIRIDNVEGNLNLPSVVNVSISINSGEETLKNITTIRVPKPVDVFLLSDLSGSMFGCGNSITTTRTRCRYTCTFLPPRQTCNYWLSVTCNAPNNNPANCIGDVCNTGRPIQPNSNSTSFSQSTERYRCYYRYSALNPCTTVATLNALCTILPAQACTGDFCHSCNNPGGTFTITGQTTISDTIQQCLQTKLDISKSAAKNFTDSLLNFSGNRLGIIPFSTIVDEANFQKLSSDANSLKISIDHWTTSFETCICCAINRAIVELTSSINPGVIVLMSDGRPTQTCPHQQGTGNSLNDAVKAAQDAYNKGINIFTIGFGLDADRAALQQIASAGNGTYYDSSDVNALAEAYRQISEQISREYKLATNFKIAVVFLNEKESYTYIIDNPPQRIFESEKYSIEIPAGKISPIIKIEIYPVMLTESGKEIFGPLLSVWKAT